MLHASEASALRKLPSCTRGGEPALSLHQHLPSLWPNVTLAGRTLNDRHELADYGLCGPDGVNVQMRWRLLGGGCCAPLLLSSALYGAFLWQLFYSCLTNRHDLTQAQYNVHAAVSTPPVGGGAETALITPRRFAGLCGSGHESQWCAREARDSKPPGQAAGQEAHRGGSGGLSGLYRHEPGWRDQP